MPLTNFRHKEEDDKKAITPMVGILVMKLWLFGGNSNNGANCGLAYANSNNAWSNSNSNISARHTFWKRIILGCYYCVMGKHPITMSLGSWCVCIASVGRNNIHLAWVMVSHPTRGVSKPF
jgi:hypothetical protein